MNRERIEDALRAGFRRNGLAGMAITVEILISEAEREAVDEALEAAAVEIESLMVGNTKASTTTPAGAARIVRSHKGAS